MSCELHRVIRNTRHMDMSLHKTKQWNELTRLSYPASSVYQKTHKVSRGMDSSACSWRTEFLPCIQSQMLHHRVTSNIKSPSNRQLNNNQQWCLLSQHSQRNSLVHSSDSLAVLQQVKTKREWKPAGKLLHKHTNQYLMTTICLTTVSK